MKGDLQERKEPPCESAAEKVVPSGESWFQFEKKKQVFADEVEKMSLLMIDLELKKAPGKGFWEMEKEGVRVIDAVGMEPGL